MKNIQLRAYKTLVTIRMRRQESLDKARLEAQSELSRLAEAAEEASGEVDKAQEKVAAQVALINRLTQSGNRFQIADYLAQQDYQSALEADVVTSLSKKAEADGAVKAQEQVLQKARAAGSANTRQRERLEEKVRLIKLSMDVAQMDSEDEEAEEAVVTRKLIQKIRAAADRSVAGHA
ncbi:MAG: hypothetical protein H7315_07655 [Herminiimonas sp.]|nr:hypothetical protein [Herminiimonas sp.]